MRMSGLVDTVSAELVKLRGLPSVIAAMLGTVAAAIGLGAAAAASTTTPTDAVHATLQTIPFLQIGPILMGVLAVATEYMGSQICTTLTATPNRLLLLGGKTIAYLSAASITSAAALGAGLVTAKITLTVRDGAPTLDMDSWLVVGAAVYLVLIGLLSFALTVLLRSLIAPLVTMLSLVLIASPLLAGFTEHARYLPDRAGSLLYLPHADTVLTPGTGTLVLLAWIVATATASATAFLVRDA